MHWMYGQEHMSHVKGGEGTANCIEQHFRLQEAFALIRTVGNTLFPPHDYIRLHKLCQIWVKPFHAKVLSPKFHRRWTLLCTALWPSYAPGCASKWHELLEKGKKKKVWWIPEEGSEWPIYSRSVDDWVIALTMFHWDTHCTNCYCR